MLKIGKVYKIRSKRFTNIVILKNFNDIDYQIEAINNFTFILLEENINIISKRIKEYYDEAKFFKILFNGKMHCMPIGEIFLSNREIEIVEAMEQ